MNKSKVPALREFIQNEFTSTLRKTCSLTSSHCRGGSSDLYQLLIQSNDTKKYMKTSPEYLQIVSGLGHTFIRYTDTPESKTPYYIYIDPTIGQFIPTFDGIFVGDAHDLEELRKSYPENFLVLTDYFGSSSHPPLRLEIELMQPVKIKGGSKRKTIKKRKDLKLSIQAVTYKKKSHNRRSTYNKRIHKKK